MLFSKDRKGKHKLVCIRPSAGKQAALLGLEKMEGFTNSPMAAKELKAGFTGSAIVSG